MNAYIELGSVAIQCNNQVSASGGAWSPEATRVGFILYNYVRPAARKRMGLSAGLRGNGMCFTSSLLRSIPWEAYSRNEDLEYALTLLLHGVCVEFAPEATVLSPMPADARHAESQRARWETGRYPIIREYSLPLLKGAFKRRSIVLFDALIDLLTPPLVNLTMGTVMMACVSAMLWALSMENMRTMTFLWGGVVLLAVSHAGLGLASYPEQSVSLRSLISLPRYFCWKMILYGRYAVRGDTNEWIRTRREPKRSSEKAEPA
jgi:cellulose synthase/poly-beta-1,6-N-acetylglucosamine synthase-like glycosyltransferase